MKKNPKWSIASERGDFLPIFMGCVLLFVSFPAFLLLIFAPDRSGEAIAAPLTVLMGIGTLIGVGFVVLGLQLCAPPGSLIYRIVHGRFFSH